MLANGVAYILVCDMVFVASLTKILHSYWFNFSQVTLDIIGYLTVRGTIVAHNMSNIRHIPMSNGKNVT